MSDIAKLHELLSHFDTAMLVTHSSDDRLHARPMAIAKLEDSGVVWFISSRETAKIHEIESDRRVQLILQNPGSVYLSVEGRARLVDDRARIADVWKEPFKVWFPKGKEDPDIVLIAVDPERSEYWDNSGGKKVEYLWEATRAYFTGTTPKIHEGEQHGVVTS